MKNLLTAFTLGVTLLGCSNLPIKTDIKEDHFRLENFKREQGVDLEYVHLMCFNKKPTQWAEPKQYISGEHDLWVKARVSNPDVLNSQKEAFVNFNVNLDSDKSYMLNRKREGDKISIWIQEVETGTVVSQVLTDELSRPLQIDNELRKRQCRSGSI
ncbi:hypothetical protein CXF76_11710 [Pseudoalteromonas sp. 78C3]|uniref:hypothetical protein n=1 Tax=Pseudoalteromonas sp. 78C3 TaxID=2058300 RepID=UPI000C3413C4|nr:hypothetical protein [Pseudoalteromonas sp. 78C3]PKH91431.1 hypothetical protein CXF76_11710 [Pseudoalteromonas sp. 78C3]